MKHLASLCAYAVGCIQTTAASVAEAPPLEDSKRGGCKEGLQAYSAIKGPVKRVLGGKMVACGLMMNRLYVNDIKKGPAPASSCRQVREPRRKTKLGKATASSFSMEDTTKVLVIAVASVGAALLLALAVRMNQLMLQTPPRALKLVGEPVTPERARFVFDRIAKKAIDFGANRPARQERRYVIIGGTGTIRVFLTLWYRIESMPFVVFGCCRFLSYGVG